MPKETFYNLDEEKKQRILDAAVNEFSEHSYVEVKLSRIIKASKIPRGSFYQYFEDKKDLFLYLFDMITKAKLEFLKDLLPNPENTPFLELFKELYIRGARFAEVNPKYIKITRYLMMSGGAIYDEVIGDGLQMARKIYLNYIDTDKKMGRIKDDVDSEVLADFMISTITNVAIDEIAKKEEIDINKMIYKVENLLKILKKGIE